MKNLIIIAMALCMPFIINAQRIVEKNIPAKNQEKVILDFQFAENIDIQTWDKAEIYVKARVNINDNKHNDKFHFEVSDMGRWVEIRSEIEDMEKIGETRTYRDDDNDIVITEGKHVSTNINFTVYVPKNVAVKTETISGQIKASGLIGDMELKSISGDIDIDWEKDAGADLSLKTISGDMYTDFDIQPDGQRHPFFVTSHLERSINGGGFSVELNTISGNIFLRKK